MACSVHILPWRLLSASPEPLSLKIRPWESCKQLKDLIGRLVHQLFQSQLKSLVVLLSLSGTGSLLSVKGVVTSHKAFLILSTRIWTPCNFIAAGTKQDQIALFCETAVQTSKQSHLNLLLAKLNSNCCHQQQQQRHQHLYLVLILSSRTPFCYTLISSLFPPWLLHTTSSFPPPPSGLNSKASSSKMPHQPF